MSGYTPIQGASSSNYRDAEAGRVGGQEEVVPVNRYETSLPMPVGIESTMTYVLGPITGFVFLMLEIKNDYVRFHAWQSSLTLTAMLILNIIFSCFKAYTLSDDLIRFKVPFIGDIAANWVDQENA